VSSLRKTLLDVAHERARGSVFERLMGPSVVSEVSRIKVNVARIDSKVTAPISSSTTTVVKPKPVTITSKTTPMGGHQTTGRYYSVSLDFCLAANPDPVLRNVPSPALTAQEKADWGTGYSNPLVGIKKSCVYCVRVKIDQLGVDPPFGGYKLQWVVPTGWVYADGLTSKIMYVEVASNPLIVVRKFRSPLVKVKTAVFRVIPLEWYP
jgi:hypothetical protein